MSGPPPSWPRSRARWAAVQPALRRSAEVTARTPTSRRVLRDQPGRLDRLRRDRAGIGDHHVAVGPRRAQPVAAGQDGAAQRRIDRARRLPRPAGWRGADRPNHRSRRAATYPPGGRCRRAGDSRTTSRGSPPVRRRKAGSNAARPSCAMPISGVPIGLVRAALWRQGHARRRRPTRMNRASW